ncbi:MAG: phospho-N-acetylmuramoyl-pentapeptide-transferase [Candidatus Omnitrophica bacterium]|nr:phospho-N-acetylmuramoyl-pentapeptide-transferase [Candidatus Omnitrophota bacterium]
MIAGKFIIPRLARVQGLAPQRYGDCPPLQAYEQSKRAIPSMGGLMVLGVSSLTAGISGGLAHPAGWIVLGSILGLAALGLWDDCSKLSASGASGLRAYPKLLIALAVGAGVGLSSLQLSSSAKAVVIPWLGHSIALGSVGWVVLAMMVVAGSAHAINLTDGMDGLASGCSAIALAALAFWLATGDPQQKSLLAWCASLAGACVGFLWFNSYPASVFLGDVGALGLGAAIGTIALTSQASLFLILIGGVFVAETASVILQVASFRWRNKRRIFRVAPLHHHFHLGGLSEPKIIVRFWIAGLLLAMAGLAGAQRLR